MSKKIPRFPCWLLVIYLVLFVVCAFNPHDRSVWWAENIPVMAVVAFLVISFRWWKFSNLSYFFMSLRIFLHTIGGHYSFELVPFGFINNLFGWERNMYDRIGHFIIGLYAFPIVEYLRRSKSIQKKWLVLTFGVTSILAIAGAYEIFEWWYAISADPAAGIAVLGSQGDIWDAQKDMLMDTLGAMSAVCLFAIREFLIRRNLNHGGRSTTL